MTFLDEVKLKLRITWDEEDERLLGIIESGKLYLKLRIGCGDVFENAGMPKMLLLNWIFYEYSNELDKFEANYSGEISVLQLLYGLERYDERLSSQSGDADV